MVIEADYMPDKKQHVVRVRVAFPEGMVDMNTAYPDLNSYPELFKAIKEMPKHVIQGLYMEALGRRLKELLSDGQIPDDIVKHLPPEIRELAVKAIEAPKIEAHVMPRKKKDNIMS